MEISIVQYSEGRPLLINFNQYTDGDAAFKQELITHMIDNLHELEQSLEASRKQSDLKEFNKTYHKVKTTICMLQDPVLTQTIEAIQAEIDMQKVAQSGSMLFKVCSGIVKSLEREKRMQK